MNAETPGFRASASNGRDALTLKYHPDVGGDVETMKEVNIEYERRFAALKARGRGTMRNPVQNGIAVSEPWAKSAAGTALPFTALRRVMLLR